MKKIAPPHRILATALPAVFMAAVLIAGGAMAAPCRLPPDDAGATCLTVAPASPPATAKRARRTKPAPKAAPSALSDVPPLHCVSQSTGKPMKCPPRMLTPQRVGPDK